MVTPEPKTETKRRKKPRKHLLLFCILENTSSENMRGSKYEIMTAKYLTKEKKKRQGAKNDVTGRDV